MFSRSPATRKRKFDRRSRPTLSQMSAESFRVVAFSGSLRSGSSNTGLIRMAARLAPPELNIEFLEGIGDLPFYNPDLEDNLPELVTRWRDAVNSARGLLIGMPEYNFGPSGVAKNAIDWLTRPFAARALQGKHLAMLTSAGKGGGAQVQGGVGHILGLLGNTVVADPLVQIALGGERIHGDGTTDDRDIEALVSAKMSALLLSLQGAPAS